MHGWSEFSHAAKYPIISVIPSSSFDYFSQLYNLYSSVRGKGDDCMHDCASCVLPCLVLCMRTVINHSLCAVRMYTNGSVNSCLPQ